MPTFRVINKATSQEVYRYGSDAAIEWVGMEFATHDHILVEPPAEPEVPAPTVYGGRRILSKLEFLELFTPTERKAIKTARGVSEDLDDYLYLFELAEEVNLDNASTQGGVALLEAGGLIGAGRAAEVLNG